MPKIIWCGNKSWDTDFPENTLPNNAKRIERPDNIFKSSMPYGILPLIFSYAIIYIKWFVIGERAMNPIYVPLGIILGLLLMPVHEVLHGVCYKKGQKVYIGICLKKFAAFAVCHEPISKRRFIIMSLMPMLLGIIPLAIFCLHPKQLFREYVFRWGLLVCFPRCQIIWMSTLFANKYLKVLWFILKMMGSTGTNSVCPLYVIINFVAGSSREVLNWQIR